MSTFVDNAEPAEHNYDYDLIVIGGGSGGLAASKRAAGDYHKKVACFDFVKPSPAGTTWGLGGTCVNVGCIPKKLFHTASLLGESIEDAKKYGWELPEVKAKHNWPKLIEAVQDHIGSLNWGYKEALKDKGCQYINGLARFLDPHTVEAKDRAGEVKKYTARRFIVCTGGRPKFPDCPGAQEYGISSDDIFSREEPPGKTLVVGGSYVALECAGFLTGLKYDTTVMVRSIFLRGFDQECAEIIGDYMKQTGTKFIRPAVPTKVEKLESGKKKVSWKMDDGTEGSDEFDTVLFAVGREADTKSLGLEAAGVKFEANGKLKTEYERTNVPHIYALGDILYEKLELTPTAIKAGNLLADRLYGGRTEVMNYSLVPTTVFTPIEYGSCGLSEEDAIKQIGKSQIEVFHSYFEPLEHTIAAKRPENTVFAKIICNKTDNMRVVGFHVVSPHAGEITQGYAIGLKMGATKADFDALVGIHPTAAEEFTTLTITKSSGISAKKTGC